MPQTRQALAPVVRPMVRRTGFQDAPDDFAIGEHTLRSARPGGLGPSHPSGRNTRRDERHGSDARRGDGQVSGRRGRTRKRASDAKSSRPGCRSARRAGKWLVVLPSFPCICEERPSGSGAGHPSHESKTDFCAAFLGSIVTMIDASKDALRVSLAHRRGGFPGASGGPDSERFRPAPRTR
jgi:hypothetical protein